MEPILPRFPRASLASGRFNRGSGGIPVSPPQHTASASTISLV
jgi:hypothetical protein